MAGPGHQLSPLPMSVIVPTIGRPKQLAACLDTLVECMPRAAEILVVDQSTDDAVAVLADGYADRGVHRSACEARGLAVAMNHGLEQAAHDAVLVTHDDCTVGPEWVGTAWRLLWRDPDALVTGRVLPAGDPLLVPSCKVDPTRHDYSGEIQVGVLFPHNMVVDRSAALALGGFDERFTAAAEDNDFSYRWLCAGRRLIYEPELVVWHHDWRSPDELRKLYLRYAYASGLMYAKHLALGDLRMLWFIARDLRAELTELVGSAVHRRSRWTDWREAWEGMPRGLLAGWRLERDRQRGGRPIATLGTPRRSERQEYPC